MLMRSIALKTLCFYAKLYLVFSSVAKPQEYPGIEKQFLGKQLKHSVNPLTEQISQVLFIQSKDC